MPPDFSKRAHTAELMDGESTFEEFRACLVDLAKVNVVTLAYRPTLAFLASLPRRAEPLRIADVGSGYGDTLRQIARWANENEIPVQLTGIDLNPHAARAATEVTAAERGISWITANAFEYVPPDDGKGGVDVVISSLFTHHLSDEEVVRFLRWMHATARVGWFVNDLHRHPVPYYVFRVWSTLAGWHRYVRNDGPISITRAFTPRDWKRLIADAGIPPGQVRVRWRVPFRLCVEGRRDNPA